MKISTTCGPRAFLRWATALGVLLALGCAPDTDQPADEPDASCVGRTGGGCPYEPACTPGALELCDGKDNDCDGVADEGLSSGCRFGAGCEARERCDGRDNDCDGVADEGLLNACGMCGPAPMEICDGVDNDCDGWVDEWLLNDCGFCGAQPLERCDGADNDCDGKIDEGRFNRCGVCGPTPAEVCDGVDNDCDGSVDEGLYNACGICGPTPVELCDFFDNDCDGGVDEGLRNACGGCGPAPTELCDRIDNDCDGAVDEGLRNACGDCAETPIELCDRIDNDCDGVVDEGLRNACGDCAETPVEVCDGLDNDCDGTVDEGVANACGLCGEVPVEIGGNGVDDDCDTLIDEPQFERCDGIDHNGDGRPLDHLEPLTLFEGKLVAAIEVPGGGYWVAAEHDGRRWIARFDLLWQLERQVDLPVLAFARGTDNALWVLTYEAQTVSLRRLGPDGSTLDGPFVVARDLAEVPPVALGWLQDSGVVQVDNTKFFVRRDGTTRVEVVVDRPDRRSAIPIIRLGDELLSLDLHRSGAYERFDDSGVVGAGTVEIGGWFEEFFPQGSYGAQSYKVDADGSLVLYLLGWQGAPVNGLRPKRIDFSERWAISLGVGPQVSFAAEDDGGTVVALPSEGVRKALYVGLRGGLRLTSMDRDEVLLEEGLDGMLLRFSAEGQTAALYSAEGAVKVRRDVECVSCRSEDGCGSLTYCEVFDGCDSVGLCTLRPRISSCDFELDAVRACDGTVHYNTCLGEAFGARLSGSAACDSPADCGDGWGCEGGRCTSDTPPCPPGSSWVPIGTPPDLWVGGRAAGGSPDPGYDYDSSNCELNSGEDRCQRWQGDAILENCSRLAVCESCESQTERSYTFDDWGNVLSSRWSRWRHDGLNGAGRSMTHQYDERGFRLHTDGGSFDEQSSFSVIATYEPDPQGRIASQRFEWTLDGVAHCRTSRFEHLDEVSVQRIDEACDGTIDEVVEHPPIAPVQRIRGLD